MQLSKPCGKRKTSSFSKNRDRLLRGDIAGACFAAVAGRRPALFYCFQPAGRTWLESKRFCWMVRRHGQRRSTDHRDDRTFNRIRDVVLGYYAEFEEGGSSAFYRYLLARLSSVFAQLLRSSNIHHGQQFYPSRRPLV